MIPYFSITELALGPIKIQFWGLCVAVGILTAVWVAHRAAKRRGIDAEEVVDLASWTVLAGILGARIGHIVFYQPARYLADPLAAFRVWEGGMSMFGAFMGAALAGWLFFRKTKLAWRPYTDAIAFAFPLGYGIGRIGCFLIHDHPGVRTTFPLAVKFPGGARLDHGLLLMLVGFGIYAWFVVRERKAHGADRGFLPLLMMAYGIARFILDFFRASDIRGADVRFGALTPAQFFSVALVAIGAWLWSRHIASAKSGHHA